MVQEESKTFRRYDTIATYNSCVPMEYQHPSEGRYMKA